jgi:1,4-alpha-glucan branching enzyme
MFALGIHAGWTSSATHAVLPLLATDDGVALQVETGIASHRRRFGGWNGGFWLPECAHALWLDPLLEQAGVRASCVELTGLFGLGSDRHLQPLRTEAGPVLWSVDRATMALVWSDVGYPAAAAYRDYHALTFHHHRVWSNDGGAYDRHAALALTRRHAEDFVARVKQRVAAGGVCVCALDTELLGHWWSEGVAWLEAVIDEAARQELSLTTLDDALARHEPVPAPAGLPVTSWGEGGDLRTWSGPAVADLAWRARAAELKLLAAGVRGRRGLRAQRELLALQSSDWAFQVSRGLAGDYPRERAVGHARELSRALGTDEVSAPELRGLAPDLATTRP